MTGPRLTGGRIGPWQPSEIALRKSRLDSGIIAVKADGHVADLWEPAVGDKPYNNLRWSDDNPTKATLAHLSVGLGMSEPAIIRRAVEMSLRDFEADPVTTYLRMTTLWRRPGTV